MATGATFVLVLGLASPEWDETSDIAFTDQALIISTSSIALAGPKTAVTEARSSLLHK